MLPLQGTQVQSLVRELRSHIPHSVAKKDKSVGGRQFSSDQYLLNTSYEPDTTPEWRSKDLLGENDKENKYIWSVIVTLS